MTAPPYDQHTIDEMDRAIRLLGQIGDEMAHLMWDSMKTMGEVAIMLNSAYHITVNSIEERDDLPFDYFTHESKLFKRQEGLRVYVMYPYENYDKEKSGLYELKNGINNENWVKLSK